MEPIEGVGGKRRAKSSRNICLFWVHSSTGEHPVPKSTQDVRPNFTHLQASQARSLGLEVGNSAHSSNVTYHFSKIAFHSPHQFRPQYHHENHKNISYPMVCSGQETVRWKQSYALRGLFGHVCLRKGWPSGGDDLHLQHACWKSISFSQPKHAVWPIC